MNLLELLLYVGLPVILLQLIGFTVIYLIMNSEFNKEGDEHSYGNELGVVDNGLC